MDLDIKQKKPTEIKPEEDDFVTEETDEQAAAQELSAEYESADLSAKTDSERAQELFRSNILMEWTAPEFIYYEKGKRWFAITAIVFTALITYFIILSYLIPAITFAMMFVLVYLYAQKKPENIYFALTKYGVIYGEEIHPFRQINRYWIEYDPPYTKELHLEFSGKLLMSKISIPLLNMNPLKIRKIIGDQIREDDALANGFIEALSRLLRF